MSTIFMKGQQPNLKLETWNIQNPPAGESDEEVKTLSDEASSQLTLKLQKVIAKKNQVPPKQKASLESPPSTVLLTTHFEASCAVGIVSDPEVPARNKKCALQKAKQPERLGSREMQEISVVAKSSVAEDFFASFFGLSKKEEKEAIPHSVEP